MMENGAASGGGGGIVEANGSGGKVNGGENISGGINVDLTQQNPDSLLAVDISDALSEQEKVKFTVHTKTNLEGFTKTEMSVVREHDEFIWLHSAIEENEDYMGYIVPPPPPRPDFDASRDKLTKLGEGEAGMTKEEFTKMKAELEAEYLATFKKTVAMHEVFLQRLASHPKFRNDHNYRVFLEFEQDLNVRGKNVKEIFTSFFGKMSKTADEVLLSGQKDVDDFFHTERDYNVEYFNLIKDATGKCDRMTRNHKAVADSFIKISTVMEELARYEKNDILDKWMLKTVETFEKARKLEARVSSDEDLKQSDTLRYYMRETNAAKSLLIRRLRCLANYESANKNLERARAKARDVQKCEAEQQAACEKFEQISELAKGELKELKTRRVSQFKKALVELAELEVKHAKAHLHLIQQSKAAIQNGAV